VGAKLGTFGIYLNDCLANQDGELVIQEKQGSLSPEICCICQTNGARGGAMGSCDSNQCTVIVKKGDSATMECHESNCKGTVDRGKQRL
jgi:hypothetical protein